MGLTTYTLQQAKQQLVEQFIATLFANSPNQPPPNTDVGAVLGAVFNSEALLFLLGQSNVAYAVAVSRLSSSTGADVDSFVNAFGIYRGTAVASQGSVIFSTSSPATSQILIPPGTVVQTATGLQFVVIADPTQPGWSAALNAYVIPINGTSIAATVQCTAVGSQGDVLANTITVLWGGGTPIAQVSAVTNPQAFQNGANEETDAALKQRFTLQVSTGKTGTANAIGAAVLGTQTGLTYSNGDQVNADGSAHSAYFTIVVNELGQNAGPSPALLSAVQSSVNATRSEGISFQVIAPVLIPANVTATIDVSDSFDQSSVLAACSTALAAFLNNIGLDPSGVGTSCPYGYLYFVLFGVPGVEDVTGLTLNSGTSDITATFSQQIVAGTFNLTPAA